MLEVYYKNEISKDKLIEEFKKLKNDPEVLYVVPDYEGGVIYNHNGFIIKLNDNDKPLEEYTKADFPELKIKKISKSYNFESLIIEFETDIRCLFKSYCTLIKDERVKSIEISVIGITHLN